MIAADLAAAARIVRALAEGFAGGTGRTLHEFADDTEHQPDAHNRRVAAALLAAARREFAPETAESSKLREMAQVIDDAVAHYHRHGGLDEDEEWLAETSRRLRLMAEPTPPAPRVWLPGDTVPAGVWVFHPLYSGPYQVRREYRTDHALIGIDVPEREPFVAAVAAEQARRAAGGAS